MTLARENPSAKSGQALMIGESEDLQRARRLLRRYAGCNASVLIEGETGTGKELAAREIHYASARSLGPFVPVNCGALPESLLESELFGHRRGAFTDARSSEQGLVEYARGGSLFLDEIDSLSPRAQTTLLRFLQNGEFRAVGERPLRTADVRIIAATNVALASAVEAGLFRRDLFYRLNPLYVNLPPLRHRGDDVKLLARHLLDEATARLGVAPRHWSPAALQALQQHRWPGNVRELENLVLRLCMRSDADTIDLADLAAAEPMLWGDRASPEPARRGSDTPPAPTRRGGDLPSSRTRRAADAQDPAPQSPGAETPGETAHDTRGDRLARVDAGSHENARPEGPALAGTCTTTAAGLSRFAVAKRHAIEHFERDYLLALMRRADGNISRAALLSGTERRQLGKLLKRHGIERRLAVDA